jgi:mannose-6-phosphate isomerase-like protein (cupin superfamily)
MKLFFILLPSLFLAIGCTRNSSEKGETTFRQLKYKKKIADTKKKGLFLNLEEAVSENYDYRNVLYTGKYIQLAIMSLEPGEDIGWETHARSDQFIRVESGSGLCLLNDEAYELETNDAVLIPAGAKHNILNNNDSLELKLYMLYARPVHKDKISRSTKEEAREKSEHFDGETTE